MSESVDLVAALGGELVTYTPHGGVPKTFKAIVERRPSQVAQAGGFTYPANTLELLIPIDATDGMTVIQIRKDWVRFKKNLNDTQETDFTVNKIVQEDVGMVVSDAGLFRVEVQA